MFFSEEDEHATFYKIIPVVLIILILSVIGKRVIINMQNKTVETSLFGLMKDIHSLKNFQRFVITKHRTNFINTGISLYFEFLTNGKLALTTLNKYYKLSKVEALLEETKMIINQK